MSGFIVGEPCDPTGDASCTWDIVATADTNVADGGFGGFDTSSFFDPSNSVYDPSFFTDTGTGAVDGTIANPGDLFTFDATGTAFSPPPNLDPLALGDPLTFDPLSTGVNCITGCEDISCPSYDPCACGDLPASDPSCGGGQPDCAGVDPCAPGACFDPSYGCAPTGGPGNTSQDMCTDPCAPCAQGTALYDQLLCTGTTGTPGRTGSGTGAGTGVSRGGQPKPAQKNCQPGLLGTIQGLLSNCKPVAVRPPSGTSQKRFAGAQAGGSNLLLWVILGAVAYKALKKKKG